MKCTDDILSTCKCNITSSSLIALPEPGIDGLMSKCCPLISFIRTLDNGLSVFIELGQICLSLFARSTFSNYFTSERELLSFSFQLICPRILYCLILMFFSKDLL